MGCLVCILSCLWKEGYPLTTLAPLLPADAVVYLRGRSEVTDYLMFWPEKHQQQRQQHGGNGGGGSGGGDAPAATIFTMLAPAAQDRQYVVRDWHRRGGSSSSSSSSGNSRSRSSSSSSGFGDSGSGVTVYAAVYTAAERNGMLIAVGLAPNALAAPAGSASGGRRTDAPEGQGGLATGNSSDGTGGGGLPGLMLLQPHSLDVEIVDLTVSQGFLTVLERRNGTLSATAYPFPADGALLHADRMAGAALCVARRSSQACN